MAQKCYKGLGPIFVVEAELRRIVHSLSVSENCACVLSYAKDYLLEIKISANIGVHFSVYAY